MNDKLDLETISELLDFAEQRSIKPRRVASWKEAKYITRHDPEGRKWRKGQLYYWVKTAESDMFLKPKGESNI